MPLQNTSEIELQEAGGDNPAPQSGNYPVGCTHEAPIPVGVELLAQVLLHQAGSAELAKKAVEGAAHRESIPDFREDLFGRRFGFATRGELLAASTPVIAVHPLANALSARKRVSGWPMDIKGSAAGTGSIVPVNARHAPSAMSVRTISMSPSSIAFASGLPSPCKPSGCVPAPTSRRTSP